MANFNYISSADYFFGNLALTNPGGSLFDLDNDDQFEAGDFDTNSAPYVGTTTIDGIVMPVFSDGTVTTIYNPGPAPVVFPPTEPIPSLGVFAFCFLAGTGILSDGAETAVENLCVGDRVTNATGAPAVVKWIGRQTVFPALADARMQPVRIRAGALGVGLPHSDLTVSADHGMIVDGLVINASALVNGHSIDWVPMAELPDRVTYYHIETEAHDVILANGAPAETFMDAAGRMAFDNYQEYLDLYGAERIIAEMDRPRISAQRLLPDAIKARLGIVETDIDFDQPLSA